MPTPEPNETFEEGRLVEECAAALIAYRKKCAAWGNPGPNNETRVVLEALGIPLPELFRLSRRHNGAAATVRAKQKREEQDGRL